MLFIILLPIIGMIGGIFAALYSHQNANIPRNRKSANLSNSVNKSSTANTKKRKRFLDELRSQIDPNRHQTQDVDLNNQSNTDSTSPPVTSSRVITHQNSSEHQPRYNRDGLDQLRRERHINRTNKHKHRLSKSHRWQDDTQQDYSVTINNQSTQKAPKITHDTLKRAIIYKEILDKPKSLR